MHIAIILQILRVFSGNVLDFDKSVRKFYFVTVCCYEMKLHGFILRFEIVLYSL